MNIEFSFTRQAKLDLLARYGFTPKDDIIEWYGDEYRQDVHYKQSYTNLYKEDKPVEIDDYYKKKNLVVDIIFGKLANDLLLECFMGVKRENQNYV